MKIRFLHDVDALLIGGSYSFGMEEQTFDKGDEVEVVSVTPQAPPNSDMAEVKFADGRTGQLLREDFEVVNLRP